MELLSKFAERLDYLMFEKGMNATKLAKTIGVKIPTVTRYLRAERTPSVESLVKIADYFNCSCDYLVGRTDYDYPTVFHTCPPFSSQLIILKNHSNVRGWNFIIRRIFHRQDFTNGKRQACSVARLCYYVSGRV